MSLFDDELIDIALYYVYKETKQGKKLIILEDEDGKKMLEDEKTRDQVKILNTRWKQLTWKESNAITRQTESTNPQTGAPDFDFSLFQDLRVKNCLKWWDIKQNETDDAPIPVTDDAIDKIKAPVIRALLDKFEASNTAGEDELKK